MPRYAKESLRYARGRKMDLVAYRGHLFPMAYRSIWWAFATGPVGTCHETMLALATGTRGRPWHTVGACLGTQLHTVGACHQPLP